MFLLLRSHLKIPPFTPAVHGDVNCQANLRRVLHAVLVLLCFLDYNALSSLRLTLNPFRSPIHVFAYRTHAHSLGSVISGYRLKV